MELFTLGKGYTEKDIREAVARADRLSLQAPRRRQRRGPLRRQGARRDDQADLRPARQLRLPRRARPLHRPPQHAPFLVAKLWEYFVGTPIEPSARTRLARRLPPRQPPHRARSCARSSSTRRCTARSTRPTWSSRRSSSSPARCARCGEGITRSNWVYLLDGMGQLPFRPPSVAGWEWGTRVALDEHDARALRQPPTCCCTTAAACADGSTPTNDTPRDAVARARSGRRAAVDVGGDRRAAAQARRAPADAGADDDAASASSAPTCASARCASCCSPARTRRCTEMARQPLRAGCDDFRATSEATRRPLRRRLAAHAPPGARLGRRRRAVALRRPGDAGQRARWRRPPPTPRRRPTRRCSSRSSCPAGWTCSTR